MLAKNVEIIIFFACFIVLKKNLHCINASYNVNDFITSILLL